MLDSRFPQGSKEVEKAEEESEREIEQEVMRLLNEARLWRLANSAQWVMWGVMQAKIPDLPDFDDPTQSAAIAAGPSETNLHAHGKLADDMGTDPLQQEEKDMADDMADRRPDPEDEEVDEEFDYLSYTWERAMFFWGDAVGLGLIKLEELPESVRKEIKVVNY
jgi:choline kinase